jgi:phosphate transport system protein
MTTLREHTSQDFEAELTAVRQKLLAMGKQVDDVLDAAGRALAGRDVGLANDIILGDEETDSMELEIDHLCLEVLARRQPVAGDLRLLTSALKMVVDLERVGDLGVSIASRVVELGSESPIVPYEDLLSMLTTARGMVSEALAALVSEDVARANRVLDMNQVVATYGVDIFNGVVLRMRENPDNVDRATRIQAISKYIERIGAHGTNLAELVIFVLTGEDVRHLPRSRRGEEA